MFSLKRLITVFIIVFSFVALFFLKRLITVFEGFSLDSETEAHNVCINEIMQSNLELSI